MNKEFIRRLFLDLYIILFLFIMIILSRKFDNLKNKEIFISMMPIFIFTMYKLRNCGLNKEKVKED